MKTSTNEVRCDWCDAPIPVELTGSSALYVTVRGQSVGHRKFDLCGAFCFKAWAADFGASSRETPPNVSEPG